MRLYKNGLKDGESFYLENPLNNTVRSKKKTTIPLLFYLFHLNFMNSLIWCKYLSQAKLVRDSCNVPLAP